NKAPNGRGGAIFNNPSATMTIQDSAILGNTSSNDGGAIYTQGTLTVTRTAFIQNSSTSGTQAIADASGNDDVSVSNSTITLSSGAVGQGAVGIKSSTGIAGTFRLTNDTIVKNGSDGIFRGD